MDERARTRSQQHPNVWGGQVRDEGGDTTSECMISQGSLLSYPYVSCPSTLSACRLAFDHFNRLRQEVQNYVRAVGVTRMKKTKKKSYSTMTMLETIHIWHQCLLILRPHCRTHNGRDQLIPHDTTRFWFSYFLHVHTYSKHVPIFGLVDSVRPLSNAIKTS